MVNCRSGRKEQLAAPTGSRSGLQLSSADTAQCEPESAGPSSRRSVVEGQLVCSLAGRDKGHLYLVARYESSACVWVVDGRKRPLAAAKRKNPIHLQPVCRVAADLTEKLAAGTATDEEVRAAINVMLKEGEY